MPVHASKHDGHMATRRPGLRSVLANTGYRRLFAAQTISRSGDTVNTVALVVLVFRLTGSGLGVSGVVIAEILPVLLLAPAARSWTACPGQPRPPAWRAHTGGRQNRPAGSSMVAGARACQSRRRDRSSATDFAASAASQPG